MKSVLIAVALSLFAFSASAADRTVDLSTPRGGRVQLDLYNPEARSILLLAQGQSCAPRLDMYDTLAAEANTRGLGLARLHWSYCASGMEDGPSDDLGNEKMDVLIATDFLRGELGFAEPRIFLGGKSLGTLVASELFREHDAFAGLVLLTPICTNSTNLSQPPNAFATNYPGLATETRPVLLVHGNADDLCLPAHFQEFLRGKPSNFISLETLGDHGFGIRAPSGEYDPDLGSRNLRAIARWIFAWLP